MDSLTASRSVFTDSESTFSGEDSEFSGVFTRDDEVPRALWGRHIDVSSGDPAGLERRGEGWCRQYSWSCMLLGVEKISFSEAMVSSRSGWVFLCGIRATSRF